jgi:two-component sensor histidine kinase
MQSQGEINIRLTKSSNNHFILEISDNGIGLPEQFDAGNNKSLGLKLMRGLSEDLSARFSIENRKGTRIIIDQTKSR